MRRFFGLGHSAIMAALVAGAPLTAAAAFVPAAELAPMKATIASTRARPKLKAANALRRARGGKARRRRRQLFGRVLRPNRLHISRRVRRKHRRARK